MVIAFLTPVLWFRFRQAKENVSATRLEKVASIALLIGAGISLVPGATFSELHFVGPTWTGITYTVLDTNVVGDFFIFVMMISFVAISWTYSKKRKDGSGREWLPMFASLLFVTGAIEEGLVVMDILPWPFMGSVAFSLGNILIAVQLAREVVRHARQLDMLNEELEVRIVDSTNELMSTRQALMVAERHTAMGSLAAGVSHEINNPLAYVTGNLHFVREAMETLPERAEEVNAIDDAIVGAERIQEIIINQRLFVQTRNSEGVVDVEKAIAVALRVVKPQTKYLSAVEVEVEEQMFAALDESRLVQVLVNLVLNASETKDSNQKLTETAILAFRMGNFVCIEVTDNNEATRSILQTSKGAKFDGEVAMSRQDVAAFVCRGIVEACGGSVTSQVDSADKAVVRVTIPLAVQAQELLQQEVSE